MIAGDREESGGRGGGGSQPSQVIKQLSSQATKSETSHRRVRGDAAWKLGGLQLGWGRQLGGCGRDGWTLMKERSLPQSSGVVSTSHALTHHAGVHINCHVRCELCNKGGLHVMGGFAMCNCVLGIGERHKQMAVSRAHESTSIQPPAIGDAGRVMSLGHAFGSCLWVMSLVHVIGPCLCVPAGWRRQWAGCCREK